MNKMDVRFIIPFYRGKIFIDRIVSSVERDKKVLQEQG